MTTKAPRDRFLALHHAGHTADQIADALGVASRTVVRYRRRYGVAQPQHPRTTPLDEAWHARVRDLISEGASRNAIAEATGVSADTVRRYYPGHRMSPAEAQAIAAATRAANRALRKAGLA